MHKASRASPLTPSGAQVNPLARTAKRGQPCRPPRARSTLQLRAGASQLVEVKSIVELDCQIRIPAQGLHPSLQASPPKVKIDAVRPLPSLHCGLKRHHRAPRLSRGLPSSRPPRGRQRQPSLIPSQPPARTAGDRTFYTVRQPALREAQSRAARAHCHRSLKRDRSSLPQRFEPRVPLPARPLQRLPLRPVKPHPLASI